MSDVYIVGADMIAFGRYPDRTYWQLGAEASLGALDDAGLSIKDIGAIYASSCFNAQSMLGQKVLKEIGQTGVPCINVSNACASGATAVREAFIGIKSGIYDAVLAVGSEKNPRGMLGGAPFEGPPPEGLFGSESMPAVFAEAGMVHAAAYGTTLEQFAQVAVKNHHHATMNPKAAYRKETPLEEVLASEMIAWPLTKLMCSANVDGAAALVLVSEKKAREIGMSRAVRVRASMLVSDPYEPRNPVMFDCNSVTRLAAAKAYEMAGLGPQDLDLVELHDCFATAEILHYENLGLCGEGEAGRLIDSGDTALGGRIPVNVSGGLLSKGHPIGATGVANMVEIVEQLRGEVGARQVAGARIGLSHVLGFGAAAGVHILEKA
ncbi:thiolase family protein [Novosphingobium sp. JCM 18896]|uniref:thiolase family protein n=1 Tax=Novosphingobium sp. JCM 18896 TaxID=2989731 RepID=UPI002222D5C2|nr:thiolase family protein [Novosphingobium sp. JCM 18896]MCW1428347.1 thiolase family protein [Novosphingobium sp. JCM 18896]